ncbi:MAG: AGE family epimerase/isomerase [Bacteroidaceae bacterium]|nr:AGE family epimerase/isomerase [Bacteroidaceae bacterium]
MSQIINFRQLAELYRSELLDRVIPFWINKSQDTEFGGYFTCLDRDGSVYDTDKFIWLQGREVWMFSKLYNTVEPRQEWLDAAIQGAEFLRKYGHDGNLNWYFALDREGHPLVEPYNIFSYTFATIAFGQLSIALRKAPLSSPEGDTSVLSSVLKTIEAPSGAVGGAASLSDLYASIAKRTFDIVLSKTDNPKGRWSKASPGARAMKTFDLPMILCNVALEIEPILTSEAPSGAVGGATTFNIQGFIDDCLHEVMDVFYRPELGLIVEALGKDGNLVDCFDGRKLNPGHAIEAMWFVMDLGKRLGRPELIQKAVEICLQEVEYGWDKEYGGIFYFMDRLGKPRHELEWDQKLWWVHLETLISLIKGYQLTGDERCLTWFQRVHDYTWSHFRDPDYPEWYGYLNRQGEVLLPLKGGKWKGCFHVPRGLLNVWKILEAIQNS